MTAIQSWFDAGQNRESGGSKSEATGYSTAEQGDRESSGSGPSR